MKKFVIVCHLISICFAQEIGARYLIITHDNYYNAIKPLAEWKTQKGYKTKIVRLSEIGSDSTQIRNYVVNAYNTWDIKPEYLLLVGNKHQLPFPLMGMSGFDYYYSDNYYTNVVGDFRNEIIPGRLWVFDSNQVKTIVAKILGYEKSPYLAEPQWFKKGTIIVNVDDYPPYSDSVYWADAALANDLMTNAGFVQIDTLSDSYGHSSADVINSINDGRIYVLYRGVGFQYWDYPFWDIDTSDMYNGHRLFVVISATCATVEGIGYSWLNAGTPQEPKGTVGFYGTTTVLEHAAELRSAVAKGTIQAIFRDSLVTLGKAAEAGRINYYNIFGNTLEYDGWTCLGDPEMTLWTTTPRVVNVLHTGAWVTDTYSVQIKHNAQPVESALVCIMTLHDSTNYFYERTDHNGNATFVGSLHQPDSALLTVTGRNLLPIIDTIIGGYTGGPFLTYYRHLCLDTIGGNGNYQPNNGENVELALWIRNIGDSPAYGVTGILQTAEPDNYFQISDTIKSFGDIPSSDSAFTSEDGFNISIHPDCPDSHQIKLRLIMMDIYNNTWISNFCFLVYSPRPFVIYKSYNINDSIGGNGDKKINPGENIELGVWLQNIGDSMAENVTGILRKESTDSLFTLDDTIKFFGTILPMDSAYTGDNGFNIFVDTLCPDQHLFELQIKITDSLDSTWIYNFNLVNYAPFLTFDDYYINDTLRYILPGETASLRILVKNIGSTTANSIIGRLTSLDTLITVINDSTCYGNILPDSISGNQSSPFLITADSATVQGHSSTVKLALDGLLYHRSINVPIYIGRRDYLVWDPDPNHSSGFVIHQRLVTLGYNGKYSQSFLYDSLNLFKSLFVTCGMYPSKFVIYNNSPMLPEILDFLNDGGKMYLEGGDVWHYDPYNGGYNFCPVFCITPLSNNIGVFSGVHGCDSTFTHSMNFTYSGETSSVDWITPNTNGIAIFKNRYNERICGVVANHQTIGLSFEFGGLVDSVSPSTKLALVDSVMHYFNITPSGGITEQTNLTVNHFSTILEVYPNPFRNHCVIKFQIPSTKSQTNPNYQNSNKELISSQYPVVSMKIYDITGRVVKSFNLESCILNHASGIIWSGDDDTGRKLPAGVYFIRLETDGLNKIEKTVLLR
ncbi:MAG: C25 family cysteine peptidase [candidate division WOR-3 bacterium]